jgi:hypothetical protein
MKRMLAVLLCVTLAAPGCATAHAARTHFSDQTTTPAPDRTLLLDYVRQLPIGSRVKSTLVTGQTVRGTLMKVTSTEIVVQPRTRVPEPPRELPIDQLRAVEPETQNGGVGRAVAVGLAAGAGAALGVLLVIAALVAWD